MSDAVRSLKDAASQLMVQGKLQAALQAWQSVLKASPDDIGAHQKVAEVLVKLGQTSDAVQVYEAVAKRYAEKGLFFKASAMCRVLLGLDPSHQATQELIASMYSRSKARLPMHKPTVESAPVVAATLDAVPTRSAAPSPPMPPPPPTDEVEVDVEPPSTASGLPSIPLFSTLTRDELREVLSSAMEVRAFSAGEVVVAEGAIGDSMFALVEGEAGVFRGWQADTQRRVASIASGDVFGEAGMVSGAPRLATVVAEGEAIALQFHRGAMAKVVDRHPQVGTMVERFYRQRLLANALRASPILRGLSEGDKKTLSKSFSSAPFNDGQRILTEGQPAEFVYLLLRGVCSATHQSGERYPDLREGDLFGEVSVLTGGPVTATVDAVGPVLALKLSAAAFKAKVLHDAGARLAVKTLAKARLQRTAQFDQPTVPGFPDDDSRV